MNSSDRLEKLARLIRYDIITSTTAAGSGHATSSLSAVELMAVLFFNGFFRSDLKDPHNPANDRFILSKGHASPLLYSLYQAAGVESSEDLLRLRKFNSPLQGHPSVEFPFVDVATGSLGQGLSVGLGMCLGLKVHSSSFVVRSPDQEPSTKNHEQARIPKVFVLLGDSEMAEGQVWEAIQVAAHYKLNNLIGIIDVNRLGQRGETMLGWDVAAYARRIAGFGWNTITIGDGHDIEQVQKAYEIAGIGHSQSEAVVTSGNKTDSTDLAGSNRLQPNMPTMIIAKTIKGKGVSFWEDQNGHHGIPLKKEQLDEAIKELGEVDLEIRGEIRKPESHIATWLHCYIAKKQKLQTTNYQLPTYKLGELVATREAYGDALAALSANPQVVALDAEVSNSTMSEKFAKAAPGRFFEMFIAEQNMVSAALGMSKLGFVPFASSFACFLTRAHDQIRMSQYSKANLKIVGSHAGVSIGEDGPSQMGLEDISMMRAIEGSVVFYPSDATSTAACTKLMATNVGIYYLRTTRAKTPVIYDSADDFNVGRCNVLKQSDSDKAVVFAAGITLHEALKAHEMLQKEGINIRVVDLYCVKPLDVETIKQCSNEVKNVIVVEDHFPEGGLGEAVLTALANSQFPISNFQSNNNVTMKQFNNVRFTHLAVKRIPRSGSTQELLAYEQIDAKAIIDAVKSA